MFNKKPQISKLSIALNYAFEIILGAIICLLILIGLGVLRPAMAQDNAMAGYYPQITPQEYCEDMGGEWVKYDHSYHCAPKDITPAQEKEAKLYVTTVQELKKARGR